MINKYIKKPVEVEALQIHGNVSEIKEFIGENGDAHIDDGAWKAGAGQPRTVVIIYTLEGIMRATDGDYIIKGVKGEFYPCRKDIFEETYELAEESDDWAYLLFDKDRIKAHKERRIKEAEERGMTLIEYLESKEKLSWLGKNCKDCGNEKCKKLGTLPKGYDCALWQPESEE